MIAAAILGVVGRVGSRTADQLGFTPTVNQRLLDGRWSFSATLNTDAGFKNARVDAVTAVRLPELLKLPFLGPREDFVELGGTCSKNADGRLSLTTRWSKLRVRTARFEVASGLVSHEGDPVLSGEAELIVRTERIGVRSLVQHQLGGDRGQLMTALTLQTPGALVGLFVGAQQTHGRHDVRAGRHGQLLSRASTVSESTGQGSSRGRP